MSRKSSNLTSSHLSSLYNPQLGIMATTNAYPPGGTFLDSLKKSFTDVPIDKEKDNAISTTEFLEAAESLTTLFGTAPLSPPDNHADNWPVDVLGSVAFTPVKNDMLGNIKVATPPLSAICPQALTKSSRKQETDNLPRLPTPLHCKTWFSTS